MSKNNYKSTLEAGKKIVKDRKGKEIDELEELIKECERNVRDKKPFSKIVNKLRTKIENILNN